jgi:hypothetical protein
MALEGDNLVNLAVDQHHIDSASARAYAADAGHCFLAHPDLLHADAPLEAICTDSNTKPGNQEEARQHALKNEAPRSKLQSILAKANEIPPVQLERTFFLDSLKVHPVASLMYGYRDSEKSVCLPGLKLRQGNGFGFFLALRRACKRDE